MRSTVGLTVSPSLQSMNTISPKKKFKNFEIIYALVFKTTFYTIIYALFI
jgi:hypothetical protein